MSSFTRTLRTCSLVVLATLCLARAESLKEARVAVMPFASESLDPRDLFVIAQAVRKAIAGNVLAVADATNTKRAIQLSGCETPDMWTREDCLRMVGRQVQAQLVLGGTVNTIGSLMVANISLYNTSEGTAVWSMEYEVSGTLEDFYKQVPAKLAETLPSDYTPPPPPKPAKPHVHAHELKAEHTEEAHTESAELVDVTKAPAGPQVRTQARNLVVGVQALFALGDPVGGGNSQSYQSTQAYMLHAVYPTVKNGQVRLTTGIPTFKSYKMDMHSYNGYPDAFVGLEYEWSMPRAAIGIGLGYMYMQAFSLRGSQVHPVYRVVADYAAYYEPWNCLNMSVAVRGGRPNGGFMAKLSWPLPFIFANDEPDNYYLEYSALGVFGSKRIKAGIGVSGTFKSRDADYIIHVDTTIVYSGRDNDSDYREYSLNETYEYTAMVPCVKVAGLIADHFVVTLDLELGGTIIPRQLNDVDSFWWSPYIGIGLVYSIGKMDVVQVMDGRF